VDDDLVRELSCSPDAASGAADLADVVRRRLAADSHGNRFARIERDSIRWKVSGGDGDPPALPLLALAVKRPWAQLAAPVALLTGIISYAVIYYPVLTA